MIRDIIHPGTWMDIADWAMSRRRITNKMIRDRYGLDESRADLIYAALKQDGIIGKMGYVKEVEQKGAAHEERTQEET